MVFDGIAKVLELLNSLQGEGKWEIYPFNPEPMFANVQCSSIGKIYPTNPMFTNIHHIEREDLPN